METIDFYCNMHSFLNYVVMNFLILTQNVMQLYVENTLYIFT